MPNYIHYDPNQVTMVVISFADQLQPGTFEHALAYLFDHKLDLSKFANVIKNDEGGRPAYDPAILLKIVLFAYSKGVTSSREIEWNCRNNIIFKALSYDSEPHYTSIASFVSKHSIAIEDLFEQVLLVCYQQGLIGNELFAIDGCKMSSNAAKEWSGTINELTQKRAKIKRLIQHHVAEHKKHDKSKSRESERLKRIEQSIETLDKAFTKVDSFLKSSAPRMGQGKRKTEVKSNITDNQSAKMTTSKGTIQGYNGVATVDKKHQIVVDAQAFGAGQEHHTLVPVLESLKKRYQQVGISGNIFETGAIVTADTGFANEANMAYLHQNKINAYIPDNQFRSRDPKFKNQKQKYGKRHRGDRKTPDIIPSTAFQFDPIKRTCICPDGNEISYRGETTSQEGKLKAMFEGRLLQCRNCAIKSQCMRNPGAADHRKGSGRQVSFVIDHRRKPTFTDWMKHRVDSDYGKQVYGHRMSVVEPVFANIGTNKKLNRFSLRGKTKVQAQWQMYCLVHNIEKLARYSTMAA